ncbi:MarR family winged helix-turn-helix transcriptional regulator [Nocardia altamirensis]|uniref:MarR family winged helix-turn-helix transcriptional regulator n=1 Tax=Nocardia altamirensis TaxID=472158 RepID=UPI0008400D7D|nr:MarR family transcriptional regulator [Nocardia altamirensis]
MEISRDGAPARLRALPTRLVNQVALVANRATERALEATGSRRYHYALLAALGEFGSISQADLGRRTNIDRSDIVATVNELSDRGFVERSPDPDDRRRKIVTITAAGTDHLAELDERLAGAQDELLAGLSSTDRAEFLRLLTRILDLRAGTPKEVFPQAGGGVRGPNH